MQMPRASSGWQSGDDRLAGGHALDAQVENGILFIEDVAEPAYRIERMLLTLDMAGILRRQQAVVVCDLQGADRPAGWEGDFRLSHALDFMRLARGFPS